MLGVLVLLSLALITVSFREQSRRAAARRRRRRVASALQPLEIAVERVARPFRDAYGWTKDLFNARSENERLKAENEQLRAAGDPERVGAAARTSCWRRCSRYQRSPAFPEDYNGVAAAGDRAAVGLASTRRSSSPPAPTTGSRPEAPVVTAGRAGRDRDAASTDDAARVRLLTDESSAVSALDLQTRRAGHRPARPRSGDSLVLDRVSKKEVVEVGDTIVTAGWRVGQLASLYPKGIPIGRVTSVGAGQTPTSTSRCRSSPFVDFSSLDAVIVLVPKRRPPELP